MIGILGSGFGLYGYLPAACRCGFNVALLSRTKKKFATRPELLKYASKIHWFDEIQDLFSNIDTLIFALPPFLQRTCFEEALKYKNIEKFIFEKPLEKNPDEAKELLQKILHSKVNFRVSYTFCYALWGKGLIDQSNQNGLAQFSLSWVIKKSTGLGSNTNWKYCNEDGGGLLRFYGIHALALAIFAGFDNQEPHLVEINKHIESQMFGIHINSKQQNVKINLGFSETEERFDIEAHDTKGQVFLYKNSGPFGQIYHDREDVRIPILESIIDDLMNNKQSIDLESKYLRCNDLWQNIEHQMVFNTNG